MRINGRRRKIVIAGSGPAGLVAAYLLAKRDFDVTIIEKSSKIGGQLNLASASLSKEKIGWFIEDYKNLCDENGVEFRLITIATPEIIEEYNPWAVIIATGSKPIKPIFDGKYEYKDLLTFDDILSSKITPENKKVAVIGSGMTGLETAEYLNNLGCKTIVIEMASSVAPGTWMQHVDDIMPRLKNAGTEIYTNEKLISVFPDKIITKNTITGENTEHHVDITVLALGTTPDNSLKDELNGKVKRLFSIGDCTKPGRIADATKAAFELVKSII
jgi:pyruvate/2-oxoglutarate dehydrogenase complex dihydrolipoamide dehydrogenase (E3) component